MSIKTVLTAALFKRDDAGRTVVYPNGAIGRGYIVPDAAAEQKLRRALMWMVIASGALGGIGAQLLIMFFGNVENWTRPAWAIVLAGLIAVTFAYRMVAKTLTSGMTPSKQRMSLLDAYKRQAQVLPRWYLWFMVIFAALAVPVSLVWMLAGATAQSFALGLAGAALFGVVMAQAIYGLTRQPQASH